MKKAICLCLAILMIACTCVGCGQDGQKETEPQVTKAFELKDEKITTENVSPYEGKYLEYGDVETVSGIYAMKFTNTGDQTIQLLSWFSAMAPRNCPSGWKCCLPVSL